MVSDTGYMSADPIPSENNGRTVILAVCDTSRTHPIKTVWSALSENVMIIRSPHLIFEWFACPLAVQAVPCRGGGGGRIRTPRSAICILTPWKVGQGHVS